MYYVYVYIDPKTNLPFYVGKGKENRAYFHLKETKENTENIRKFYKIQSIKKKNLEPIIKFIYENIQDENEAYNLEEELILKYGRIKFEKNGILTNICLGTRPPKPIYTEERKQKYRESMMGNTINKGRIQTDEEKQKRSNSLKEAYRSGKRQVTDKMRETTRLVHTGKKITEETRERQRKAAQRNHGWKKGKTNEEIYGKKKAEQIRRKKKLLPPPNCKPITINNIKYSSIREASVQLNITEYKVRKLTNDCQ